MIRLKNRFEFALPGILLMVLLVGCSKSPEDEAKKAIEDGARSTVKTFFDEFSVPKEETTDIWGMSDYKVFHVPESSAFKVVQLELAPNTYLVTFPFWCAGASLEGDQIQREKELHVTVERNPEKGTWQVRKYEFQKDDPLRLWLQLGTTYMKAVYIGFLAFAVGYYPVFYVIYWIFHTVNWFSFDPYGRMIAKPDDVRSKEASGVADAGILVLMEIAAPIIIVVAGFDFFPTKTAVLVPALLSYAGIRIIILMVNRLILIPYQQAKERTKPPKPVEVPDLVKKELLRQVREKIGATEYKQLVEALGEDGLIQMILQASKDK